MIKLEFQNQGFAALSTFTVESGSSQPSIQLTAESSRRVRHDASGNPVKDAQGKDVWEDDPLHCKQRIVFLSPEGPTELTGTVSSLEAVHIEGGAAHKVVIAVQLDTRNLPARAAGGFSRSLVALEVVRVLEVWETPTKCVHNVKEREKRATRVLTESGKVVAA